jgi:hypothetical protein
MALALPLEINDLTGRVKKTNADPVHGGFATIWQGEFEGRLVAIKSPRIVESEKFAKVRSKSILHFVELECFAERATRIRKLGAHGSQEHSSVVGMRHGSNSGHLHDLSMDVEWNRDGLCRKTP